MALTADNKRKTNSNCPTIPLPIQAGPTLIKIEDCTSSASTGNCGSITSINHHHNQQHQQQQHQHNNHHHHHQTYEPKSTAIQTATITTAVQTNEMSPELAAQLSYYQTHGLHGNLIQIAPNTSSMTSLNTNTSTTGSLMNGDLDFRSIQPSTHIYSPAPQVAVSTMSCLTPPSESFSRREDNLDSSGVSSLPEGLNSYY